MELPNALHLTGPPGCGKTSFVRVMAQRLQQDILLLDSGTWSTYQGGTVKKLHKAFLESQARNYIVLIDEFDKMMRGNTNELHKIKAAINSWLQGVITPNRTDHAIMALTTNEFWRLHPSLLRRTRNYVIIPPNQDERAEIFMAKLSRMNHDSIDAKYLAQETSGFVGDDIAGRNGVLIRVASKAILNHVRNPDQPIIITEDDILSEIHSFHPILPSWISKAHKQMKREPEWQEIFPELYSYVCENRTESAQTGLKKHSDLVQSDFSKNNEINFNVISE